MLVESLYRLWLTNLPTAKSYPFSPQEDRMHLLLWNDPAFKCTSTLLQLTAAKKDWFGKKTRNHNLICVSNSDWVTITDGWPVVQLSCTGYTVTYLYFRVHLRVSSPRRAVRMKLLNQEISCLNEICLVILTVIEMFLGVGSFPNADVPFSEASLAQCFILDLFVYMERSWMLPNGSTVSAWTKPGRDSEPALHCNGIKRARTLIFRERVTPAGGLKLCYSPVEFCCFKSSFYPHRQCLPKCNCHIWGNY